VYNWFGYVWENPYVIQCNQCLPIFKNRLVDCFIQKWFNDINNSPPLSLYKHIKCSLHYDYEQYLDHVVSKPLTSVITKLKISAHNLIIEVGRYSVNRVQRCDRVCQLCETGAIEDEYHFVCRCPALVNERTFLPKYVYTKPSMFNFIDFLSNLTDIKAKQ
jgi:hypothetical protein